MDAAPFALLRDLLETPSPSGYEAPVQLLVRKYLEPFADQVTTDVHGNVIAVKNAQAPLRVMLDGHCDQIGLLISHIDENGYLRAQTIGGWDPQQLVGQRMTVWSAEGPVPAVISRKPIHLLNEQERKQVVQIEELWLDIGARDKADAQSAVRIGDPVTLQLGFQPLRNQLANAPGMDDKTGLWTVIEGFRRAAEAATCGLYCVSTVQEEIGLRGARTSAFTINPQVAIAVDVTHATYCPGIDVNQRGEIRLGGGPVIFRGPNMNHAVVERLVAAAEAADVPYQLAAIGRATPNDANRLQISRGGVATGLVGVPNRYMHSAVETVSLEDLQQTADLLAAFLVNLQGDEDFTP